MAMLKRILFLIAFTVGALAAIVAMRPSHYRIARSTVIQTSPEGVFPLVNDFRNWSQWSPWEKLDPNMKKTFSGAESGKGSSYSWVGNSDAGEGRMTLEESNPNERIGIKLEFIKPFESVSTTTFQFKPEGQATAVTWEMSGENGFVEKAFGLFMDMDEMVGSDFEKGLAQLKSVAEAAKR